MNWIAERLFGPMLDFLVSWMPYLWVGAVLIWMVFLFFTNPLVFKKVWQPLAGLAVCGFVVLWVWQHYAGIAKLEDQVVQLEAEKIAVAAELETSRKTASNLQTSINNQSRAITQLEANQRRIRRDISTAREGLDSETITQETQDDPAQAAADLSDRWNRLGGMFADSTSGTPSNGDAGPEASAAPPGTD